MHSSWKIWDFLESRPEIITSEGPHFVAIQCFDPFAFQMVKKRIPKDKLAEAKLNVISASDVSADWLENNLKSFGLFGNTESYLILNAHQLSKAAKDVLQNPEDLILDERYLFLEYSKEDDLLKKIKNNPKVETIKIQPPGFWEIERLLDFLCDDLQVYLDMSAKELILNRIAGDIANFTNILQQIKINFPDAVNLSATEIAPLVRGIKSDQFELANDFASKKLKAFYMKIQRITDFDDLRQIFLFMQSHLLKIYDTNYTVGKSRLTKYDKEVLAQAKIWRSKDLDKAIKYFSSLEIKAKSKDPMLFHQLEKDFIRLM